MANGDSCADAIEIQPRAKSKAHEIVRIFTKPLAIKTEASARLFAIREILRVRKADWLARAQRDASNFSIGKSAAAAPEASF
jgi:hypothetical protein